MLPIVPSEIQSHIGVTMASFSLEMPQEFVETMNTGREMLQSVGVSTLHT